MRLALAAIRRAGDDGNDRTAVLRAAFRVPDPGSALGRFAIDRRGDTTLRAFAAYAVRAGRMRLLHAISH